MFLSMLSSPMEIAGSTFMGIAFTMAARGATTSLGYLWSNVVENHGARFDFIATVLFEIKLLLFYFILFRCVWYNK